MKKMLPETTQKALQNIFHNLLTQAVKYWKKKKGSTLLMNF